jgi:hypothetical protein
MNRVLLAAVTLAMLPLGSFAGETVRLNVSPSAAPKPALKYLLLPEVRELNPGNPVQWYVRCFAEQRNFFFGKEATAERARLLVLPLDQLPKDKLPSDKLRRYGGHALTQADWGARLDAPDWQILERVQTDGMDLMLPEQGPLRILGTGLRVRFRLEIAGKRFDDAVGTAKTMFALARHLGENPTVAANRTGFFIANLALDTLEEMVGRPGCPNLYWALTDQPCPLVDLRKGIQGDRALVMADLRPIRADAPMTEEEIEKVVSRLSGGMGFAREQAGRSPRNMRAALKARVNDSERVKTLRAQLVGAGGVGDLLQNLASIWTFPPVQVILLDEKREYEARFDARAKLLALGPWQIDALPGEELGCGGDGLFADLLPDILELRRMQARLEQRVALLRHVEALRMHATAHEGKLPQKLDEVAVPLPVDPFTGKPFVYKVEAATAHLHGSPPRGEEKNADYNIHYEITLRK